LAAIDLPDINVWIALSAPDHVHRARAERYWSEEASSELAFNAVTMLGLVRVCSNAPSFAGVPLSPTAAWTVFQSWTGFDQVVYLSDPGECLKMLDSFMASGPASRRTWTDSYLAAFAITAGLRLVSFDGDFHRFTDLDFLYLEP
jgi:toxin-antitoxin system PIN domain toxin